MVISFLLGTLDPCFYSTKVLVRNRHCTWTTHFRRSTNKLTRWVSRTGTMNFNHEVRSLPGTTATISTDGGSYTGTCIRSNYQ